MRYSEDLIQEIRVRNDIVSVISSYVKLTKKGGGYFGCCPFHNEKTPSFHVRPDRQTYHCFGCGVGGNVITFMMEYENYSFQEGALFSSSLCSSIASSISFIISQTERK